MLVFKSHSILMLCIYPSTSIVVGKFVTVKILLFICFFSSSLAILVCQETLDVFLLPLGASVLFYKEKPLREKKTQFVPLPRAVA